MKMKHFIQGVSVMAAAAVMCVTSLPVTVMASGLTDVTADNTDPYKAASTGLVTTTLPTSMDDSVSDDGTAISGSAKLEAFLAIYQSYDRWMEYQVKRLDADSTVADVAVKTWMGDGEPGAVYDGDRLISQFSALSSQDFDITSPTGYTDATAGHAEIPLTFYYTVGEDSTFEDSTLFEQPLKLNVKWGAGNYDSLQKFTDIKYDDYFEDSVAWGLDQKIVSGTSDTSFSPNANVTRAQFVTFLYRYAGSPDVEINKTFKDISGLSGEFQKAISWAAANGITSGKSDTTFAPNAAVKREEAVTFLFRYTKGETVTKNASFKDVKNGAYYVDAISWGAENGIVKGMSADTFGVGTDTTRGAAITFIYRTLAK